jgi:hypothetical protein
LHNNESEWILVPGAYEAIVSPETFELAQQILKGRSSGRSNQDILEGLRRLLAERGKLSTAIIDECRYLPGAKVYDHRFGGLLKAYSLIGYKPSAKDETLLRTRAHTLMLRDELTMRIASLFPDGLTMSRKTNRWRPQFKILGGPTLSLQVVKIFRTAAGKSKWRVIPNKQERMNITLLARLTRTDSFLDFHVLPDLDFPVENVEMTEHDPRLLRGRQLHDLSQLLEIVRQVEEKKANQTRERGRVLVTHSGVRRSCSL